MITPSLMTVFWVLGLIGATISVIVASVDGLNNSPWWWSFGEQLLYVTGMLLGWLILILFLRVTLELMAVLFRSYERLVSIDERGRGM